MTTVGANLRQSGFTRWCLPESVLERLGVPEPFPSPPPCRLFARP
jgi:hypothetical protein